MQTRGLWLGLFALVTCAAIPAAAVVIAGPDGSANTPITPPNPDPGIANVGKMGGTTAVYVRNGWILTAGHVEIGAVDFGGAVHEVVPNSRTEVTASPPYPDVMALKLVRRPLLPDLQLAAGPPFATQQVVMIGQGRNRGDATTWFDPNGPGTPIFVGWEVGAGAEMRWGTNRVDFVQKSGDTEAFVTVFDDLPGPMGDDEAQVVDGDSGGGVFSSSGELIGIMYSRGYVPPEQAAQPTSIVLFQNASFIVNLDAYATEIHAILDQPDCDDGLDEDGDGLVDYPADPGCDDLLDDSEWSDALVCDNGIDDDLDTLIDYPADYGCTDLLAPSEVPESGLASGLAAGGTALLALGRRGRAWPRAG